MIISKSEMTALDKENLDAKPGDLYRDFDEYTVLKRQALQRQIMRQPRQDMLKEFLKRKP